MGGKKSRRNRKNKNTNFKKMGIPKQKKWKFNTQNMSWKNEINEFYKDITYNRKPNVNLIDAYQTLKIINTIYKNSKYANFT